MLLEYEVENGDIYETRTKKTFTGDEEDVSLIYNKNNPTDIMVNGFYRVSNTSKYFRLVGSLILLILPNFPL